MDQSYKDECTRDWEELDSKKGLKLWCFFDTVHWSTRYAIEKNGEIAIYFDKDEFGNTFDFFDAVVQIV